MNLADVAVHELGGEPGFVHEHLHQAIVLVVTIVQTLDHHRLGEASLPVHRGQVHFSHATHGEAIHQGVLAKFFEENAQGSSRP